MDNKQEQLNNLSEIRSLMERSSSFISLSGLSGVSAGIIGLVTSIILYFKIVPFLDNSKDVYLTADRRSELIVFCIALSVAVLLVTFLAVIFFTSRKAKKKNLPVWDSSAKRLLVNLFIPLIAGGLFCLILIYHYFDWLVIPSMLIFYGLALINAGKYTLGELRWLGIFEVILGLLAAFFLGSSVLFWGIGFGVMNIIYGAAMYFKYDR
jgi:hypothetical protein